MHGVAPMTEPVVFVSRHHIKPGSLEDSRRSLVQSAEDRG